MGPIEKQIKSSLKSLNYLKGNSFVYSLYGLLQLKKIKDGHYCRKNFNFFQLENQVLKYLRNNKPD
jgi:hypothetical protein